MLEEEQAAENEREQTMNSISDPSEKKRIEKIFGMERAKAQARIQQISDKHDDEIKKLKEKFGFKGDN